MPKETTQIDLLFLELSQVTRATTAKELKLAAALRDIMTQCPESLQSDPAFLEAWDKAVILLDCMPKHLNLMPKI